MKEQPQSAILQRDKETYAIVPRIPGGLAKLEDLKKIVEVVEKYNIPIIKITSGHRLALVGMKGNVVPGQLVSQHADSGWQQDLLSCE